MSSFSHKAFRSTASIIPSTRRPTMHFVKSRTPTYSIHILCRNTIMALHQKSIFRAIVSFAYHPNPNPTSSRPLDKTAHQRPMSDWMIRLHTCTCMYMYIFKLRCNRLGLTPRNRSITWAELQNLSSYDCVGVDAKLSQEMTMKGIYVLYILQKTRIPYSSRYYKPSAKIPLKYVYISLPLKSAF